MWALFSQLIQIFYLTISILKNWSIRLYVVIYCALDLATWKNVNEFYLRRYTVKIDWSFSTKWSYNFVDKKNINELISIAQ